MFEKEGSVAYECAYTQGGQERIELPGKCRTYRPFLSLGSSSR